MSSGISQSTANPLYPWHEDFYIGPSSQPVDIASFLSKARNASESASNEGAQSAEGEEELARTCSVDDLKDELDQLLAIPAVSGFIKTRHDAAATKIFELSQGSANDTSAPKAAKARSSKSRKRKHSEEADVVTVEPPEVAYIREELDGLRLQMGNKLPPQARFFIRRPRMADQNSLRSVMDHSMQAVEQRAEDDLGDDLDDPDVVLSISVYTPHSVWPNGLRLSSMHDLLASNTLADLMRVIPCQSAAIPHTSQRIYPQVDLLDRACIGMEDVVYGRHPQDPEGIAELLTYLGAKQPGMRVKRSSVAMENVRLGSLSLRMNYPYWIFHAGMCEHIWTIDRIHFHHTSEPEQAAYPLTTFLPGSTAPNCGVCKLLPAVIAVSGDVRLGESPCLVCKSCWDLLGWPRGDEEIKVVRLIGPRTGS